MAAAEEKEDPKSSKKDPICDRSNAPHFFAASALLALTVVWAIADETWMRRPYKKFQTQFVEAAGARLEQLIAEEEKRLKAIPDYQAAVKDQDEAQKALGQHDDARAAVNRKASVTIVEQVEARRIGGRGLRLNAGVVEAGGEFFVRRHHGVRTLAEFG